MPHGKPAGIPCVQLLPDLRCALFGKAERPSFCTSLRPTESMCGASRADALARLTELEFATRPGTGPTARPEASQVKPQEDQRAFFRANSRVEAAPANPQKLPFTPTLHMAPNDDSCRNRAYQGVLEA